ncbi:hypothetical protein GCM10027160_28990 [Streptomyces calidiresistens]|uniref:Uncharacterized protein n=1 Tax=Streptomyces calidiresistens TaxID=1485586 RepID=A0A7W3XVA4_9ACTN|nr:hypothetical protein [Streptomyces calidiresistens]MBB0228517.1 hypothetical protein [Streptomyces calidiresistens]
MSLAVIRAGIADRLTNVPGLRSSIWVKGNISPPTAVVVPGDPSSSGPDGQAVTYDGTFGNGCHDYRFLIAVLVSTSHDPSAQRRLDEFLEPVGPHSIKAAVEAGGLRLDDRADHVRIAAVTQYGIIPWAGIDYLGATLRVEATASVQP